MTSRRFLQANALPAAQSSVKAAGKIMHWPHLLLIQQLTSEERALSNIYYTKHKEINIHTNNTQCSKINVLFTVLPYTA